MGLKRACLKPYAGGGPPLAATFVLKDHLLIYALLVHQHLVSGDPTADRQSLTTIINLTMTSDFIAARSSRLSGFAVWSDSDLGSSNGTAYDYNVIKVHVILGSLATMLFLPLGILIPRYARGLSTARWWFPAHMTVQGLAALLAIGALGIALYLGGAGGSSHQVRVALFSW